jgi:RNA polymerase sigma factor (sigma-70 family)
VAAEPSIGRATRVERPLAPGADAASDLYERYSAQIHGYCLHQLGSREEAEDAVQTTFMNAFRGLQRGIVPELESAWLFKIAHNVCLSRRRSSWRRGKVEAPNNFEVLQEVIPGREQVADELIGLQDVLEQMPENQRRAILLREWQGLTYREISTELGLSQAAVETLIFRARRALAQGLEQDADTWKKRLRRGADVGGAIAFVKALLGGGGAAAVKVAASAVAVATTAVAAATEMPRQVGLAPSAKPTPAIRQLTRPTKSTIAATAATSSLVRRGSTATDRRSAGGVRNLPRPVAPLTSPQDAGNAPTSAPPPAQAPPAPEPSPSPSAPEPAASSAPAPAPPAPAPPSEGSHGNGPPGNGGGDHDNRTPQSTTQPPEPPPVTTPVSQPDHNQGGNQDKPDTPSDNTNTSTTPSGGHGSSNSIDNSATEPAKPGHGDAKGNGKDK